MVKILMILVMDEQYGIKNHIIIGANSSSKYNLFVYKKETLINVIYGFILKEENLLKNICPIFIIFKA